MENNKETLTKILKITALILTVITMLLGGYVLLFGNKTVEVQDFKGSTAQSVMSWVDQYELKYDFTYEYNETESKDIILYQSIPAGEHLKKNEEIKFTVSKGPDPNLEIEAPDFTSMTKEELEKFFEENKFSDYTFDYAVSKTVKKDGFIKINNTNEKLKRNDLIVVTLSIGSENVGIDISMPDFSNETKSTVKKWCKENNINCKFEDVFDTATKEGELVSQSPKANEPLKTGGSANFEYSLGNGVKLDDLTGKTKEDVEKWAKENNANVQFIEYYSDSTKKGTVISTTPKSGTVTPSTRIKVYISLGSVIVPDFTGKKEADVKNWVEETNKLIYDKANHISFKVVIDETSKKTENTIISTSPAKNETAKFKTVIKVNVAGAKKVTVENKSNITVEELKTYLTKLELKLGDKIDEVYSSTIQAGKIVSHDSGEVKVGSLINYTISLGIYSPNSSTFNGKSSDEAKLILQTANSKNAGNWSLALTESYSDTVAKGNLFDCVVNTNSKDVSCKVSKGEEAKPITINNDYVGKTKGEFVTFLSEKGLIGNSTEEYSDTVEGGKIISIQTGTYYKGNVVNYVMSLGKDPSAKKISINDAKIAILNAYPKDGMSIESTKNYISNLLTGWGFTNVTFESVDNDEPVGTLLSHNLTTGEHAPDISITVKISTGLHVANGTIS